MKSADNGEIIRSQWSTHSCDFKRNVSRNLQLHGGGILKILRENFRCMSSGNRGNEFSVTRWVLSWRHNLKNGEFVIEKNLLLKAFSRFPIHTRMPKLQRQIPISSGSYTRRDALKRNEMEINRIKSHIANNLHTVSSTEILWVDTDAYCT
jgi:hypothetical protein